MFWVSGSSEVFIVEVFDFVILVNFIVVEICVMVECVGLKILVFECFDGFDDYCYNVW